jgi:hypothetical protein
MDKLFLSSVQLTESEGLAVTVDVRATVLPVPVRDEEFVAVLVSMVFEVVLRDSVIDKLSERVRVPVLKTESVRIEMLCE